MKEFTKAWKSSKAPKKQRKYLAKAPLHIKRNMLSVNLSKDLRTKTKKRNIVVRKDDKVKIMRGKFKGKEGKVLEVKTKLLKIYVEGMQAKKQDGSKVNVPFRPSNLQIIEMVDRKSKTKKSVEKKTETTKKEISPVTKSHNSHPNKNSVTKDDKIGKETKK
jgi:large subunit ribosomal protein L24